MDGIMSNYGLCNPYFNNYCNYAGMTNLYDNMNTGIFSIMPFAPAFNSANYQSYFNNMKNYLNFTSDYNLQMVENQRKNEISINAADAAIKKAAAILEEKIEANEQEQIMGALNNFKDAIRMKYKDATEDQISSYASVEWAKTNSTTIPKLIREKGTNSYLQGLYQVISLGYADNITAEENISKIYNQPVSRKEKTLKVLGRGTGGAMLGVGATIAISPLISGLKKLRGKWAILGAIAGSILAMASSRTPKNENI